MVCVNLFLISNLINPLNAQKSVLIVDLFIIKKIKKYGMDYLRKCNTI